MYYTYITIYSSFLTARRTRHRVDTGKDMNCSGWVWNALASLPRYEHSPEATATPEYLAYQVDWLAVINATGHLIGILRSAKVREDRGVA